MQQTVTRISPLLPAISLEEAREALNEMPGENDVEIQRCIDRATDYVQERYKKSLRIQEWEWELCGNWCDTLPCSGFGGFKNYVRTPYRPIVSFNEIVGEGESPIGGWQRQGDTLCIEPSFCGFFDFAAGYGPNIEDVPPGLRAEVLRRTVELYENRSERVVGAGVSTIETVSDNDYMWGAFWV